MLMRMRSFAGCRRVIVRRHHFTLFTALATTQITYATCIRWKYKALHFDIQNYCTLLHSQILVDEYCSQHVTTPHATSHPTIEPLATEL